MPVVLAERLQQAFPDPDLAGGLGKAALNNHLELVRPEILPVLTPFQTQIVRVSSLGITVNQVAEILEVHPKVIHEKREVIPKKLGAKNMAQAVNMQIENGDLKFRRKAQPKIAETLNVRDRLYMNLIAQGWTDAEIANRFEQSPREINRYNQGLFKRAKAWNRPHLVRRGWEMNLIRPLTEE